MEIWMNFYELAKKYYEHYNNLEVPKDFKTIDGINYNKKGIELGLWVYNQRKYNFKYENYSKEKIELLDKIGMVWSSLDSRWNKNYELAKKYYLEHGNLDIKNRYEVNGINLGNWIYNQRRIYNGTLHGNLSKEHIDLLNKIGMIWSIDDDYISTSWMEKYNLAKNYFNHYNNLEVPIRFKTKDGINYDKDGINLGTWLSFIRTIHNGNAKGVLTKKQIELLDQINMIWNIKNNDSIIRSSWIKNYNLAKKYYNHYGNLCVYFEFKTNDGINYDEDGFSLGFWVHNQRRNKLNDEQIELLNEIGMVWKIKHNKDFISENWLKNYELVKKYYNYYGNTKILAGFKTNDGINYDKDGINLGTWLRTQKSLYTGKSCGYLNIKQIELLENINITWFNDTIDKKLQRQIITDKNKKQKEIEILNRFKSCLIQYKNKLPNKDELNKEFILKLK